MNLLQRIARGLGLDIGSEKRIKILAGLYNSAFSRWGSMFAARGAKQRTAMEVSARGLVYTCVQKWEKAELAAPIYVKLRTNQMESRLAPLDHRAVKLLDSPNPIYSSLEVRSLIDKYLIITGNIFIFTPDFDFPFPLQMWLLEPSRVRIVMGKDDDLIQGYEFQGTGGIMFFPEKYVCHIRTLEPSANPEKALIGTGIVEAAIDNAIIDIEGMEFLKRYFANDARPPQILRDAENILDNTEKWEQFKTQWNSKLKNNQVSARLHGTLSMEQLQGSSTDMDYVEISALTRQGITEVFNVPLTMVEGSYGSRATAQVIEAYFKTGTINPFMRIIDSALTKHFRQWDESIIIEHEYYVDKNTEEQRAQELHEFSTGQISINELLKAQNKPSIGKDGDARFVPATLVPLAKALLPTPPPNAVGFSVEGSKGSALHGVQSDSLVLVNKDLVNSWVKRDLDAASNIKLDLKIKALPPNEPEPDEKLILWKSFDSLTQKKAVTLQGEISDVFASLEREILGNIEKGFADYRQFVIDNNDGEGEVELLHDALEKADWNAVTKADLIQVSELFNEEEWIKNIEEATGETLTELQRVAILESLRVVGSNLDYLPSDFSELMKKELAKSTAKITDSIGTIKSEVQDILHANTDATASELRELLTKKFDTLKVSRAETIARTSANHTTNAAQEKTWTGLKITSVWLSQRDGDVRDTHLAADGQERDEDGNFHVGGDVMPHPCGGSIAGENVNCRCMQFPEKKKVKE